jgi:uncharacterized integral membrane protein
MKVLSRVLVLLLLLLGILMAVSNTERVALSFWPLPYGVQAPLYLLIVAVLLLGVLIGLGLGWWAGRHHRRRAREYAKEAKQLDREVIRLRETLAERAPAAAEPATATTPGQKAIERQVALVAPDLAAPPRGPLS